MEMNSFYESMQLRLPLNIHRGYHLPYYAAV